MSLDPVTSEHELTCQAEGYPEAEVIWTSSDYQILSGKTTITSSQREEKLFNVTSTLRVNATTNEIFYCTFRRLGPEENSTAVLVIPGNILNVSIKMHLALGSSLVAQWVKVQVTHCGMGLIPGLGTSVCYGCSQKKRA